mgnify:CR=1 FL=1
MNKVSRSIIVIIIDKQTNIPMNVYILSSMYYYISFDDDKILVHPIGLLVVVFFLIYK